MHTNINLLDTNFVEHDIGFWRSYNDKESIPGDLQADRKT